MSNSRQSQQKNRLVGIDVARALAIFGMVIVNFKLVMQADTGNAWLKGFASLFEGRASALFVVLAGVGIAFFTQKTKASPTLMRIQRVSLIKRACLLIIVGLTFVPIWPADILHFYGLYFLVACCVFHWKNTYLWALIALLVFSFPLLTLIFNYDAHWHWESFDYQDFWSIDGLIRHWLFNGFHPVIPWCAFLIFGLWLGQQTLSNQRFLLRTGLVSLFILTSAETLSYVLTTSITDPDTVVFLSTEMIPPMPLYMISAAASATLIIIVCLLLCNARSNNKLVNALSITGQWALTLYLLHVILGMGVLEELGYLSAPHTVDAALLAAGIFCTFSIGLCLFARQYVKTGPAEWVLRYLSR